MGRAVNEITECNEGSRETNCWAVKGGDENFGMCVECMCYVEVVSNEVFEPMSGWVIGA